MEKKYTNMKKEFISYEIEPIYITFETAKLG